MLEAYQKLFESYLRICKKMYNPEKPYDLKKCIGTCEKMNWELVGMIDLIEDAGEITIDQAVEEKRRIFEEFDTVKLYGAYKTEGEIMIFGSDPLSMPEDPHEF